MEYVNKILRISKIQDPTLDAFSKVKISSLDVNHNTE